MLVTMKDRMAKTKLECLSYLTKGKKNFTIILFYEIILQYKYFGELEQKQYSFYDLEDSSAV